MTMAFISALGWTDNDFAEQSAGVEDTKNGGGSNPGAIGHLNYFSTHFVGFGGWKRGREAKLSTEKAQL